MTRGFKIAVIAFLAGMALAGCGIRGSLDPPSEAERTTDTRASADSGQGKPEDAAPKPHKDFVLDRLIR